MSRRARRLMLAAGTVLVCAATAFSQGTTYWTNAARDSQWGNPANWTRGLPDADTSAGFSGEDGTRWTVDLGGITRHTKDLNVGVGIGSLVTLTNGTLSTPIVNAGSDLDLRAALTTDAPVLTLRGNDSGFFKLNVYGPIVGNFDVDAAGTFAGANTYTGRTLVRRRLTVADGGEISASRDIVVDGGLLTLASATTDPLNSRDVQLRGGRLAGEGGVANIGQLSLPGRHSQIGTSSRGALVAQSLARSPGATLETGLGVAGPTNLRVVTPPAMSGAGGAPDRMPVLPWATGHAPVADRTEMSFVTYDASGFRPLDPLTEYAPTLTDGANVRLAAGAARSSDVSVNTLSLRGSTLTLGNGARLTLAGGGMLMAQRFDFTGTAAITGAGSLALPAEGIVHTAAVTSDVARTLVYTIDVPVSGGMLTKTGLAPLALTRSNTYSAGTTINQGIVRAMAPASLGTGPVRFNGGFLDIGYADGVVTNDLVIGGASNERASVTVPSAGTTTFAGSISGTGSLTLAGGLTGGGTVRLAGGGATDGRYEIRAIGDTTVIVDGTFASPDSLVGSAYAGFGPAVFGGNGTIRGTFDGGNSRLSPGPLGNLPGRLTIGQALLGYSTVYHVDISGRDTASGYDQLVVLDRLALGTDPAGGGLDVLIDPSFLPSPGDRFTIIDDHFIGPVQGTFGGLAEGSTFLAHGTPLRISYVGGDGNDVVLKVVPEPGLLAAPPLFGLLLLLRRR